MASRIEYFCRVESGRLFIIYIYLIILAFA